MLPPSPLLHRHTLPPGMGEPAAAASARYASRVQTIFDSGMHTPAHPQGSAAVKNLRKW